MTLFLLIRKPTIFSDVKAFKTVMPASLRAQKTRRCEVKRYKKWIGNGFDDKDLVSFGLADERGYLTNAGALIADESPIRCSRLFCTRWNGLNKSGGTIDALDDAEYGGSIISLIEKGENFIKRNANMMWRKTANSREEMPEFVERSYHEALVNGLGNRDYLIYGSGFGKIISGYEFQKNYTDNKKPTFRSDRYQFTVIMPNLNYVPQDVPQGLPGYGYDK